MKQIWSSRDLEQRLEINDWIRLQGQVCSRAADLQPIPTKMKSRLCPLDDVRGVLFDIYGTLLISDAGESLTVGEQQNRFSGQDSSQLDDMALLCLPKLLRASLNEDFQPSKALKQSILEQHQKLKSPALQYPEVDIVSLWQQIFLQQLNEDMHSSLSPFILARFALEYELLHNQVQLMPGALELLRWLANRNFYIGIISNAQFYTPIILSALLNSHNLVDLNIRPDLCFWSYRHACCKPQMDIFGAAQSALAHHHLKPKEILYLGNDMRNDVWGAAQAGFRTALFAGDQRSLRLRNDIAEVSALKPDNIVTELSQLKSVL